MNYHWTQSLTHSRYIWDIVLLVSFVIVMSPNATTIIVHEWVSLIFLTPFTIHLLLHWQWIVQSGRRFFSDINLVNRWHFILDVALYLTMTFAIISGFLASEALLQQINANFIADAFWTQVHHQYSNLLFPLLGIHLAVHWRWIIDLTKRVFGRGGIK